MDFSSCVGFPKYGLGACLVYIMNSGSQKPIAYASCTLSKSEGAYAQIECEGLGFGVWGTSFHQYLYGHPFILVIDHLPLCKIYIPPMAAGHVQRWAQCTSMRQLATVVIACQGCRCLDNRWLVLKGSCGDEDK